MESLCNFFHLMKQLVIKVSVLCLYWSYFKILLDSEDSCLKIAKHHSRRLIKRAGQSVKN
jgi:hypothetical protein